MNKIFASFKNRPLAWCIALLCAQNFIVFFLHYLGVKTFTKDFVVSYYPMTAYWISFFQNGIFAQWVPYQTMGMPTVLTMQSGLFYPPYWLFALTNCFSFTLHAATVFQCLHVLVGAIGALLFSRLLGLSFLSALFCAVCFQFFGGSYVISSSPDIIRSYAWLPWLFWATHITQQQNTLAIRNFLLPFVILFLITGGYPGTSIAQIIMAALLCFFYWCKYVKEKPDHWLKFSSLYFFILLLTLTGVLLSSVYLAPLSILKEFLMRGKSWDGNIMNWSFSYWNTLFAASHAEGLYKDPATRSAFIGLPAFCLLFLLIFNDLKKFWPLCLVCFLSIMMARGQDFFLYYPLINAFEFLGYSRFIASDYRGVFALILIFMATYVFESIVHKNSRLTKKRIAFCLIPMIFCFSVHLTEQYLFSLPREILDSFIENNQILSKFIHSFIITSSDLYEHISEAQWWIAITFSTIIFCSIFYLQQHKKILATVLFIYAFISGGIYLYQMKDYWQSEIDVVSHYDGLALSERLPVLEKANEQQGGRSACLDVNVWENTWKGFLLGDSLCNAHVAVTNPRKLVRDNPALTSFMQQAAKQLDFEPASLKDCDALTILPSSTKISNISYSLQSIRYQVHSNQAFCFVENELYFPGWQGELLGKNTSIEPISYCKALRSWCLPEGNYEFVARYKTPGLRIGFAISIGTLLIYLCILGAYWWRQRERKLAISV